MTVGAAAAAVAASFERIAADGRRGIWIELVDRERALTHAAAVDARVAAGAELPLAGRTLAVKGNIDVAGHRTTAGCPAYGEVASHSAPAVQALEAAGAVVVGITNLDQFATGLVGTRSPHRVCPNAHWPGLISGGSSSGSAVAVAAGLVDLSLGTDTAGSGRVPAAANGIVGIKPTRGRCSADGVVPACASLDCVSFFAANVAVAALAARIVEAWPDDPADTWRRARPAPTSGVGGSVGGGGRVVRVGLPRVDGLRFDGAPEGPLRHAAAMAAVLDRWATSGERVEVVEIDLGPFLETGDLLYGGAFVAERYAAVGPFVDGHQSEIDPVVWGIIAGAREVAGWEVYRDLHELARLRRATEPTWSVADVFVVPSVPRLPTVEEVHAAPLSVNAMLGTYTNFVNLLDLSAVTVPAGVGTATGPPPSVTLIGPAWSDELLARLATTAAAPVGGHAAT